jgi:hypothetical protein
MDQSPVTFIINGNTYSLRADNNEAMRAMPETDRRQLIDLLEAAKEQERLSRVAVHAAAQRARVAEGGSAAIAQSADAAVPRPERLGSGDVDALMARLVMEENRHKKSPPTRQVLYKWLGVGIGVIIVLILLF